MTALVAGATITLMMMLLAIILADTVFYFMRRKEHRNWRIFSVYHFWSNGPNGYYAWLEKTDPDWWRK